MTADVVLIACHMPNELTVQKHSRPVKVTHKKLQMIHYMVEKNKHTMSYMLPITQSIVFYY